MRKKLAILGAGYSQRPLIEKAAEMGLETHVFARVQGSTAIEYADFFYPYSFRDPEPILKICRDTGIHGIISVCSDLAMPAVNSIADQLGLVGNSQETVALTTNKFQQRKKLKSRGLACPGFMQVTASATHIQPGLSYPLIVKPVDREGSLGIHKADTPAGLDDAIAKALDVSFVKACIVEEFITGREFSVEMISLNGVHHFITVTDKITTGPPHFVETDHFQPARISRKTESKIMHEVIRGLNAVGIMNGASHTEIILSHDGTIHIVEIAARMGGDMIGTDLVPLSTGYDYLKGVIEVALGLSDTIAVTKPLTRNAGVSLVHPPPGYIKDITDNTNQFPEIVRYEILRGPGDYVSPVSDGPACRAAAIIFTDDEGIRAFPVYEALIFDITPANLPYK